MMIIVLNSVSLRSLFEMVGVGALYFLFIIAWHYRPDLGAELFITLESRHMEDTMANTNKLFFTDYHYNIIYTTTATHHLYRRTLTSQSP